MRCVLPVLLLSSLACARPDAGSAPSRFLYIWTGDKDMQDSDFLAVVDIAPASPTYGQVVTTEPVGMKGTFPHHLEYQLPDSTQLLRRSGMRRSSDRDTTGVSG